MASPLARRVARAIRRGDLWTGADRVAVAVSGGADSVALVRLLHELAPKARWRLAGLIHVHHGLRGAEADADAAFCAALAEQLGLPIDRSDVDTAGYAARTGASVEAAARAVRYAAFEAAAARLDATVVATAHTSDDQAETVLLRLLRGASARGVAAIRRRRGRYARPLLECRRADLRAYLALCGQPFREDRSNADLSIPRNRLRRTLLPVVEAEWPGGVAALARFAELAADDERALQTLADEADARILSARGGVELKRETIAALPAAVARRVVRAAIEDAGGRPSARAVDEACRLARGGAGRRLELSGLRVEVAGGCLRLSAEAANPAPPPFVYTLPVPGAVQIRETGVVISASLVTGAVRPATGPAAVVLQAQALALPLTVRQRRPGDRFRPLGAPGSRKLHDLLIDRKIPRAERDGVPVVVDRDGRVIWVAGVEIAHDCRVTMPSGGMVKLEMEKKGHQ